MWRQWWRGSEGEKWIISEYFLSGYFLASASRVKQSKSNPSLSLGSALSRTWISSSILSRTFSSILEFSFLLEWTLAVEWTLIEARPDVLVAPELLSSSSSKIVDEQFLDAYIWFKIVDLKDCKFKFIKQEVENILNFCLRDSETSQEAK